MTVRFIGSIKRWIGLSTDTKPTSAPIGSTFFEYDTKDNYVTYDGGTNWSKTGNSSGTSNVQINKDMPWLTEFWENEATMFASSWEATIDGAGTQAFGTASGYMYYDIDTAAVADTDAFINSKYRWQVRPATFGDSNSMLQRFVLEFEVQAVTAIASHDNTNFFLGMSSAKSNSITQNDLIGFYLDSDALKGKTDNGGTETSTAAITATLTNWNKFKITVEDTSATFTFNGTDQTAITTNLSSTAMYIVLGTRAEAGAAVGLNIGNVRAYYDGVV